MAGLAAVAVAVLSPMAGLGFLLWLSHLEDTLTRDVQRARRSPEPPPILAIPVRLDLAGARPVVIPKQRPAPVAEMAGVDETPAELSARS